MASKRNSDPGLSTGAAPARAKNKVTRKHNMAAPETPAEAIATPVAAEPPAPSPAETPAVESTIVETAQPIAAASASEPLAPTSEDIAARAYFLWAERGYQGGSPEEDWLRAEYELNAYATSGTAA